jgi:hypothetical protein
MRNRGGSAALGAVLALGMVSGTPGRLLAQERPDSVQAAEAGARREHIVRKGDTLWDLARFYMQNPFLWPAIYDVNRSVVENPHWIYPAERLIIPPVPPEPADTARVEVVEAVREPAPAEEAVPALDPLRRTRFYAGATQEREPGATVIMDEIASLAPVQPAEYYAAPWLGNRTTLPVVARVAGKVDPGLPGAQASPTVHPFEQVYLTYGAGERPEIGTELLLVEPGRPVERWGEVIEPRGLVRVVAHERAVMVAQVVAQYALIREGQAAIAVEPYPAPKPGRAVPVEDGPEGRLIAFVEPQALYGTMDIGFIDLGREAGIALGDEFTAYLPERAARGGAATLPAEPAAQLRVVRVGDRSATVRIIQSQQAELGPGLRVRLVRKAP